MRIFRNVRLACYETKQMKDFPYMTEPKDEYKDLWKTLPHKVIEHDMVRTYDLFDVGGTDITWILENYKI